LKLVCISDTHSLHNDLIVPDGDVLIHAGDCTNVGEAYDFVSFNNFISRLPHPHKLLVGGNHDWGLQVNREQSVSILTNCTYLEDAAITIEGYKFYFSPWTNLFCDWAFMKRDEELAEVWNKIPADTDILVTHGPPYGIGDVNQEGEHCGSRSLLAAVKSLKLKLHIFGHIHEGYGMYKNRKTKFYNVSTCTRQYRPTNKPVVIDLPKKRKSK
jgi:Icc-related predicted phosphoesterase